MARRIDPRTRLDLAWRTEERAELQQYAAAARLDHARESVARRNGPGLGLDGVAPDGIPTPLAAAEHRALGEAAADLSEARAAVAYARQSRRAARLAAEKKRGD